MSKNYSAIKEKFPIRQLRQVYRVGFGLWCQVRKLWQSMRVREQLSRVVLKRRLAAQAEPVLERLNSLKKRTPGRKLCGILLAEHIGDIVACEPIIPWLRSQYPTDVLVWVTCPAYVGLLKHHPQLDAVEEIGSITVCGPIVQSGVFDRVVDLHIHLKPCAVFRLDYMKKWGNPEIDIGNYYCHGALLEAMSLGAGLARIEGQPHLTLPPEVSKKVDSLGLPSGFVVIHARSNDESRDWNDQNWNVLADLLVGQFGLPVIEVGLKPVLSERRKGVLNLCGKLSLVETAEVIRRAAVFFGIDSGPAHFANAFNVPSVILLGRFRQFQRYMPYTGFLRNHAETMIIQWDGPVLGIPVSEVLRHLEMLQKSFNVVPQ